MRMALYMSHFALLLALATGCGKSTTSAVLDPFAAGTTTTAPVEHHFFGNCDSGGTPFGAGDGSTANPYLICSVTHLQSLSDPKYVTRSFQLQIDLDLEKAPVFQIADFAGSFDGNGHTLRKMAGAALFDSSSGTIKNLSLSDATVKASYRGAILVGWNKAGGQITKCGVSGQVAASSQSGGLVGFNEGSITQSSADVTITGSDGLAVLVGINKGSITRSFAKGSVTTVNTSSGSYNNTGGLVSEHLQGTISNSYSLASVNGKRNVGGFAGTNAATITNCFSAGAVAGGTGPAGGFIGVNTGTVNHSYWDTSASGQTTSAGGSGAATLDLQSLSPYLTAPAWDFTTLWSLPDGSYPVLR